MVAHSGRQTPSLNKYSIKLDGNGRIIIDSIVTFFRVRLLVILFWIVAVSMFRKVLYHDENWHASTSDTVGRSILMGGEISSPLPTSFTSCWDMIGVFHCFIVLKLVVDWGLW